MKEEKQNVEGILDQLKEYVNTRINLAMMVAADKGSQLFANLVTDGFVLICLVLAFLFGSLALGFYLSELIGNTYAGFAIIALFYFIVALIVYLIKDRYLEKPIINAVIKKMFKERNEKLSDDQNP
jgi:ABC-type transport system involved in multi-copper enzyme maturation permease subunit